MAGQGSALSWLHILLHIPYLLAIVTGNGSYKMYTSKPIWSDKDTLLPLRNITFSCNSSEWGPAPTFCVNSLSAQYLTLPGLHFGHDVDWDRFPQTSLWRQGDGLTWTDDIPICYHPPSVGAEKVNYSSFESSVRHYNLATTFCSFDDDGFSLE